jgi:RNA polymerase sigma-70 factor (ECF subfamily)
MAAAFAELYDDEVWNVYGFFGYRLDSRELAEELTFEKAIRAWDRFDPGRASPRTWLLAIARNLLVDHFRADDAGRREPIPEDEAGQARLGQTDDPSETALGISPELETALTGLGERERELIALRFGADLTGPEIAKLTGLSLGNVHQILSRSLRRLRTDLEAEASQESNLP